MSTRHTGSRRLDPVTFEVMHGQLQGIVEEMGELVMRCGHTVFVKETQDFVVALLTPDGEVAACSKRVGIWIAIGLGFDSVLAQGEPYRPGDVWFTNDPERSGGLVTHTPDTFSWRPIFHDGELVCFAAAFLHCTDVGGMAPGSVTPSASDQYQEGVIMPPTRLVRDGQVRDEILDIYLRNSRIPAKNRGDILAMLGTLDRAESRVRQLLDRVGAQTLRAAMNDVLDFAEDEARGIVSAMPDGDYTFWDYLEGDLIPGGRPVRIRLTMRIDGDGMVLDFTGTDPQVAAAYNIATYGRDGHYLLVLGVVNYLRTKKPDIAYNSGMIRNVEVRVPRGTVINPRPGAAFGARQATFFRVADIVLGALALADPDAVPAVGCGQGSIMLASAPDLETGTRVMSIAQPLVGGSGARHGVDGTEGVDFTTGFYRNIPAEVLETEIPVLVERYGLRPDSGGAGATRGGVGLRYSLRFTTPQTYVTARGLERFTFQPWGRAGGLPAATGSCRVEHDGTMTDVGKIDVLEVGAGDVIHFETAGGGGIGDPRRRDPRLVLRDVTDGLVSVEAARDVYGVVTADWRLDEAATAALRDEHRVDAGSPPPFAFGRHREQFERRWTDDWQLAVNAAVEPVPHVVRGYVRDRLMDDRDALPADSDDWSRPRIDDWLGTRVSRLLDTMRSYSQVPR
ncbi:MAG: hydantoinase B/oxoprolinase family protein [Acidothermales bacterium]|nr:hydantoinase B/oxoprolinase family protein [Acidothermales bacterium]